MAHLPLGSSAMNVIPRLRLCRFAARRQRPAAGRAFARRNADGSRRSMPSRRGTLALLEKLVNQNSGTLNLAGVKTVGEMMRAELEPLGFKVEWLDMQCRQSLRAPRRAQARSRTRSCC